MSKLCLQRSVYDDVVAYGEMVDRVIERLGSETPDPGSEKNPTLAHRHQQSGPRIAVRRGVETGQSASFQDQREFLWV